MYKYKKLRIGKILIDEHRFVMQNHLGRKLLQNECVHHINGNTRDNRLENLQIMTRSEHTKYHSDKGDIQRGSIPSIEARIRVRKMYSKLTECQVEEVKNSPEKGSVLARKFGVSRFVISRVRSGKSWFEIK